MHRDQSRIKGIGTIVQYIVFYVVDFIIAV